MFNETRIDPPYRGDEKETLSGFLQLLRETIAQKCAGLTEEHMRSTPTVSGLSLIGMVQHLMMVERYWFQGVFLDAEIEFLWSEEDPDGEFKVPADRSASDVIAAYLAECVISNTIVEQHSLDDLAAYTEIEEQRPNLRWIMTHMIEETARHAGHADILREAIDGQVGE